MPAEEKQRILSAVSVEKRVGLLLTMLARETDILELEQDIQEQVHESIDRNQREYYLREQMRAIASELGDGDNPLEEADELREKVKGFGLAREVEDKLLKECDKLAKMPAGSHEATVVRNYLDACLSLPWNVKSKDSLDLAAAEKVLNRDHYGLQKVKERILEILAVRRLTAGAKGRWSAWLGLPASGKPRSRNPSPRPWDGNMSVSHSAASGTRPISAATAKPISAPCRGGS